MKTNLLLRTAIMMMFAGSFYSCENNKSEENIGYINHLPSCENKKILKTLNDEPGFITWRTDPLVDRIWYYFFEPATPDNEFSEMLHFRTKVGEPDEVLDKYVNNPNELVKVSGNVTNCLSTINEWNDYGLFAHEYNILDLLIIKK